MIRCIIIDDERAAINVLKRYIAKMPELELAGETTKPLIGIDLIKRENPDVVFLDIQMDVMDGIELAKAIGDYTRIVFCTAHFQYAAQSYDLNAVDYLLKPIDYLRFRIAIQKVTDAITGKITPIEAIPGDYVLVKDGERGKLQKIDIDDIVLIKAMSNYVSIHTIFRTIIAYLSLKELEDRLPPSLFVRVHRSYVICMKYIEEVSSYQIRLKNQPDPVPIGANFKDSFMERIRDKLLPRQ